MVQCSGSHDLQPLKREWQVDYSIAAVQSIDLNCYAFSSSLHRFLLDYKPKIHLEMIRRPFFGVLADRYPDGAASRLGGLAMLFNQAACCVQQLFTVKAFFVHVFNPFNLNRTRLAAEVLRLSHTDGVDSVSPVTC